MDQSLLRSYLATVYEFPGMNGPLRTSLDGDIVTDVSSLPELLQRPFAVLTAFNPRSMLLPRKAPSSCPPMTGAAVTAFCVARHRSFRCVSATTVSRLTARP